MVALSLALGVVKGKEVCGCGRRKRGGGGGGEEREEEGQLPFRAKH